MKQLIIALLISLGLAPAPLYARRLAGTFINSAHASGGANGDTTASVDMSGANFCAAATTYYSVGEPTVSDSNMNTWTARTAYDAGFQVGTQIFYSQGGTYNSMTFSVSGSGTYSNLAVVCFSGMASSPYDGNESGVTDVNTVKSTGSITPSQNDEVLISSCAFGNSIDSCSNTSGGYTVTDQYVPVPATSEGGAIGYLIQTTATASNPEWTQVSSQYIAVAVAAFKTAGGGGGGGATLPPGSILNPKCCKGGR